MIARYGAILLLAVVLSSSPSAGLTMRDDCCIREMERICPCRIRIGENEMNRNEFVRKSAPGPSFVVKDAVYPIDEKGAIKVPETENLEAEGINNGAENTEAVPFPMTSPPSPTRTTQVMRKKFRRVFCCRRFGRLIYPRGCFLCRIA